MFAAASYALQSSESATTASSEEHMVNKWSYIICIPRGPDKMRICVKYACKKRKYAWL